MIGIIGIGTMASKISHQLKDLSSSIKTWNTNEIAKQHSGKKMNMEDWENISENLKLPNNLEGVEEIYCIVDGYESIAGLTLYFLSAFKDKPITIFHLSKTSLSKDESTNCKITINVLQEYARSGMLLHIFLFNVDLMWEQILDKPELTEGKSILDLKQMVLDKICWCVYIFQQIRHSDAIDGAVQNFDDTTIYRISSFFEIGNNNESELYYPLKFSQSTSFIANAPKKLSRENIELIKNMRAMIKENSGKMFMAIYDGGNDPMSLIAFSSTNVIQESGYITAGTN